MFRRLLPCLLGLLIAALPFLPTAPLARADAQPPGIGGTMDTCFLTSPGFCDQFGEGPYTGTAANRGGALDPARWSFSRLTEAVNPGQGQAFAYAPVTAQFCQTALPGVVPDRDSFMCNGTIPPSTADTGAEDMHWMTAINDAGNYVANGARSLQPFDFAGRTGTVAFMVDAVTRGIHATWPDVVLADQPINGPHESKPGVNSPPRNGVEIDFNAGCGVPALVNPSDGAALSDFPQTTVGQVSLFTGDQERDWAPQQLGTLPCVAAQADHPNLIVLQVSAGSLDVWMADAIPNMVPGVPMPPPPLVHVLHLDASDGYALNMTRGYLSFQQAQYFGAKFNGSSERTYHWHAIGFDGPALTPDAVAEVPDSLTPAPGGQVNIGYPVQGSRTFTVAGLPAGQPGYVSLDWRTDGATDPQLAVRVNGGAAIPLTSPPGTGHGQATNALAAIPAGELRADANTVELDAGAPVTVANIDLGVSGAGPPPPAATVTPALTSTPTASPSPSATPTATATQTPQPSATPTSTATASPTDTPTPLPSATPTATDTPGPLQATADIDGQHYACVSHDGGAHFACTRP